MNLEELVWDDWNEEHIGRHGLLPSEVEEVVFDPPSLYLRTRGDQRPRYVVLGLTEAGRGLLVVLEPLSRARGYVITARDMTDGEKRRYKSRSK